MATPKTRRITAWLAVPALLLVALATTPAPTAEATDSGGTVVAWGGNFLGQTDVPAGLTDVTAISAGGGHSLALLSNGTVVAWGSNDWGQSDPPAGLDEVTAVAGGGNHSLAVRSDGTVVAWGYNDSGQTEVPAGLDEVTTVAGGSSHSLALRADGTVAAWGGNSYGQADVPPSLDEVTAIAGGTYHSLALTADGTVAAWGGNIFGERDVPAGLDEVIAIAAGVGHSLALRADGTVVAWGNNGTGQADVPAGLDDAVAVSAGHDFSLALRADGTVVAWGSPLMDFGQADVPAGLDGVTAIGAGAAFSLALVAGVPLATSTEFVGVRPIRVADTRDGTGGVPIGKVAAGHTLTVPVAGQYGVAADAKAVSLNVTVTQPAGSGYVTVYPCGTTRPLASNLNFVAGQTVPNAVVVKTGAAGAVCLYTTVTTHLLADLNGYFPSTADYTAIVPIRAADTRNGTGVAKAKVPAGGTLAVPVAGRYGIAGDATSVAANVTVTQPASNGYVTVWPCGEPRPFASNLNFVAGQTVPNAAIAGVGANGSICLYTTAATHLVVDVGGFSTGAANYLPLVPERLFDTRVDWGGTKLPAGWYVWQEIGEPGELVAVVLNVTVTQPNGPGYITVYPCNQDLPKASNLNFVRGQTVPNMVIAPVDSDGRVCLYTSQTTHILADLNGVFPASTDGVGLRALEQEPLVPGEPARRQQ